jgi:hypothetical protein
MAILKNILEAILQPILQSTFGSEPEIFNVVDGLDNVVDGANNIVDTF